MLALRWDRALGLRRKVSGLVSRVRKPATISAEKLITFCFFLAVPVALYLPGVSFRHGRGDALAALMVLALSLRWTNKWRVAMLAAAFLSFASVWGKFGIEMVLLLFIGGEAIEWIATRDHALYVRLFRYIACIGILLAYHGILQTLNIDPSSYETSNPAVNSVSGWLGEQSSYGMAMAACIPAMIYTFGPEAGLLGFIPLIGTYSTSAVGAAAIGMMVMASPYVRSVATKAWLVIGCGLLSIAAYSKLMDRGAVNAFVNRLETWKMASRIWRNFWLFGLGPESFYRLRVTEISGKSLMWWQHAHNEPLQWVFETGTLGAIALGGYLVHVVPRFLRSEHELKIPLAAMVLSMAFSSMFHFGLHVAGPAILALLAVGMMEGLSRG